MKVCNSFPQTLYYCGPWDGKGPLKSSTTHKLDDPTDIILLLDLAKEQLKTTSDGPFVTLFESMEALGKYRDRRKANGRNTTHDSSCSVDTSKLFNTKLHKVSEYAGKMGAAASGMLPDFLARPEIPFGAVKRLSLSKTR